MRKSDAFKQRYYKVEGFGGPRELTINLVVMETFTKDSRSTQKPVMYFVEPGPGLVLSATNWDRFAEWIGTDETDEWEGVKVRLWLDKDAQFDGKPCPQLRLDVIEPTAEPDLDHPSPPPDCEDGPPDDGAPPVDEVPF